MELTIALAQMDVVRADPEANLAKAATMISGAASRGATLVCLPEMWTTGFDWKYIHATADQQEPVIAETAALAQRYRVWVAGSMLALDEQGRPTNASMLFSPAGECVGRYNKIHLYTLFNEHKNLAPGSQLSVIDTPWGSTGLAVCYDLRFPELFRAYMSRGIAVQLLCAAFPYPRIEHWKCLIRARAIENQVFMVAVNQVGRESAADNSAVYFGASCIVDPWGRTIAEAGEKDEEVLVATIDLDEEQRVRKALPALEDCRPDLYRDWV